jgi:hypothetical protein
MENPHPQPIYTSCVTSPLAEILAINFLAAVLRGRITMLYSVTTSLRYC